jgi:hypothetical protein
MECPKLKEHRDEVIMSFKQAPGWLQASDGRWCSPETHPDYRAPDQPQDVPANANEIGPLLNSTLAQGNSSWEDSIILQADPLGITDPTITGIH